MMCCALSVVCVMLHPAPCRLCCFLPCLPPALPVSASLSSRRPGGKPLGIGLQEVPNCQDAVHKGGHLCTSICVRTSRKRKSNTSIRFDDFRRDYFRRPSTQRELRRALVPPPRRRLRAGVAGGASSRSQAKKHRLVGF